MMTTTSRWWLNEDRRGLVRVEWLSAEVSRRFRDRLRKPVTARKMSDACWRLARIGRLRQVRQGKGRYESRFMRVG